MVKVCKFFKDFFDEEVKGKKRLTGASLKRDYGVTRNCLDNLKNGHEMFTGGMNKIGCAYLKQFPTQRERFRQGSSGTRRIARLSEWRSPAQA